MGVRYAEALDSAVEGEDIGEVAVVEPEAGGGDEDGPVGGVFGESENGKEGEGEEVGESHFVGVVKRVVRVIIASLFCQPSCLYKRIWFATWRAYHVRNLSLLNLP